MNTPTASASSIAPGYIRWLQDSNWGYSNAEIRTSQAARKSSLMEYLNCGSEIASSALIEIAKSSIPRLPSHYQLNHHVDRRSHCGEEVMDVASIASYLPNYDNVPSGNAVTGILVAGWQTIKRVKRYNQTLAALSAGDRAESQTDAYEIYDAVVSSEDFSQSAVATYLETTESANIGALLACLSDNRTELSMDLTHTVIGVLRRSDSKESRYACLAMLNGGEYARSQLKDLCSKETDSKVQSILKSYLKVLKN